ncbi:hypothetical protein [Cellulomonas hominis]|uniref:hypothetical protein n=1 Tax=Cellulomonas hominis TaxID=156981 RepID=UPI001BCE14B3|nr:hypothetical protein [Cellulomonas hominis]
MARVRTALVVAVPLAAAAVAVTLWAAPYWLDVARHAVAEQRWPDERGRIEAAVAAVALPDGFAPVPCADAARTDVDRCWRTAGTPEDSAEALVGALAEAGVTGVAVAAPPEGGDLAMVQGVVAGRQVWAVAAREVDPDATRVEDMFLGTVLVKVTADLDAP